MLQHILCDLVAGHVGGVIGRPVLHLFGQGIKTAVASVDVEVLRFTRGNAVVTELNILGGTGVTAGGLKEVTHAAVAGFIVVDLIALVLVSRFAGNPVFHELHGTGVAINDDLFHVGLVAGLIVGTIFFGSLIAVFCFAFHDLIQSTVFQVGVNGLPVTRPVGQGTILHIAVRKVRIAVVMALFCLHTRHGFLSFGGATQYLHEVNDLLVGVGRFFQGVVHPLVGLAADVEEEVAVSDLGDVVGGGLVAVQVYAVVQKHGEVCAVGLVA